MSCFDVQTVIASEKHHRLAHVGPYEICLNFSKFPFSLVFPPDSLFSGFRFLCVPLCCIFSCILAAMFWAFF